MSANEMRASVSLPVDSRLQVAVRPYSSSLLLQLGGLTVCLTPEQARRLHSQLARQLTYRAEAG
ncbi:hypothetical protein [Pseudonocardia xishanensis]|uniref:WYL domain-containing protein n=1 Tax=Pseudonocardia xishanensis TaxID=630995 RepID=A0ABP8RZA1_9PSEU